MTNTSITLDGSLAAPAWYGKLPGTGDFAHRRITSEFLSVWDKWLQKELHDFKKNNIDWTAHYLSGSVWFFALGKNVVDSKQWIGVMMPSVDSAGRYFPLTLTIEIVSEIKDLSLPMITQYGLTWDLCAEVALLGLNQDMDANSFESTLQTTFSSGRQSVQNNTSDLPRPAIGQSLWLNSPHRSHETDISSTGLPKAGIFEALFGCAKKYETYVREVLE